MGWLASDWDSRDPKDDLHDIETGAFLRAIDEIPQSLRMLMQEGDLRVELAEVGEQVRVVKIVKKREPEYSRSTDTFFVYDRFGSRINLKEDEYDKFLKMEKNPEELFEQEDIEWETLGTVGHVPRDIWDVVFDATDYINVANRWIDSDKWQAQPMAKKVQDLQMLSDGHHPDYPDVRIYSADWFQYTSDKRIKGQKARQTAQLIQQDLPNRATMARLMARKQEDQRPIKAKRLRKEASRLPNGPEKARKMNQAEAMMACYRRSQQAMRNRPQEEPINSSDRAKLWSLWRDENLKKHGRVELTQWQYERGLYACLIRKGCDRQEARERTLQAVRKHFGSDARLGQLEPKFFTSRANDVAEPNWIKEAEPKTQVKTENYEPSDWLPQARDILDHEEVYNDVPEGFSSETEY